MSSKWSEYWANYRRSAVDSEDDLFVQVGKTVDSRPIPQATFDGMIERIVQQLHLDGSDSLLDLCCGNGLVTFELARFVGEVTAIDFAVHLIESAKTRKAAPNIEYRVGDACAVMAGPGVRVPTKILMNDALAYFDPDSLARLLDELKRMVGPAGFHFLLTGIPNEELKWNFYDTPERRERHLRNEGTERDVNDGLGRWWRAAELEALCRDRGLQVRTENQPAEISRYRMDALIWR